MRVEGTNVLITGGSSGIGLATARALAARGANVGIIARNEDRLAKAAEEISASRSSSAQRVWTRQCDVTSFFDVLETVEAFDNEVGPVDILVNSAGVILPGYFEKMPLEMFGNELELEVMGKVYACRAVIPQMIQRGHGHIVNVASMAGFMSIFGYTAYGTAKYAVMGFSEALRSEMKPYGIGVSVICPPDVDTPGLAYEHTLRPAETHRVAGNAKVIAPERVAEDIVRAIERNKYFVVTGLVNKAYYIGKSIWPGLYFRITDSDVRKARADSDKAG